jgi:hypothetical protein
MTGHAQTNTSQTAIPADGTLAVSNSTAQPSAIPEDKFLSEAILSGPNREAGPNLLEKVWVELAKASELFASFRNPDCLPIDLEEVKSTFSQLGSPFHSLENIRVAAARCRSHISNDPKTVGQLDNFASAATRLADIAVAIRSDSEYLLGFKRQEISPKAIEQLSRFISFLTAVLDRIGELPEASHLKRDQQPTDDLGTASRIITSILNNGIVHGAFAKFLTDGATLSCDGHGRANMLDMRPPCIVWHSNGEPHPNYNFSEEVAEEATLLSGNHSPLSVSLERPSENIFNLPLNSLNFPRSVDCSELERRLHHSAIVIMHLPVKIHDKNTDATMKLDPITFSGLDSPPNVWMCEIMPAEHIHKIIVPSQMRHQLDKDLPPELLGKIIYTDGTTLINTIEIDPSRTGKTIKCPKFKEALKSCLIDLERETILLEKSALTRFTASLISSAKNLFGTQSWIGDKLNKLDTLILGAKSVASLTVGIHATRLGE